jgi:hypothetical protein
MIELNDSIIDILLQDRTTDSNLNVNPYNTIPRHMKTFVDQKDRTKTKAEVFTPVSIVKRMLKNRRIVYGNFYQRTISYI